MSEKKRIYPSGALKRKIKQKKDAVAKKMPKISTFFQQALQSSSDSVSDFHVCNGRYLHVHT